MELSVGLIMIGHSTYWLFQRLLEPWRNRRAGRMNDPVARLRYLRRSMRAPAAPAHGYVPGFGWGQFRFVAALVLVGGVLTTPRWMFTETKAVSEPPRVIVVPTAEVKSETPEAAPDVWLVETAAGQEIYSNGLRIEPGAGVSNEPRRPVVVDSTTLKPVTAARPVQGIVFHTTESLIVDFDRRNNQEIKSAGRSLLDYVRRQRCYHYLIDRFGRVHRGVREEDAAWHAGESVWGDGGRIYVNLNHGFLGVAFEMATAAGNSAGTSATPAQVTAGRMLTAMLRSKYGIDGYRCVTHAQVSLNPAAFLIGLHTDWAANFPFTEMGLPDNYGRPYASVTAFGFHYDDVFVRATGSRMLTGLAISEEKLRAEAARHGMTVDAHRARARQRYKDLMASLPVAGEQSENNRRESSE